MYAHCICDPFCETDPISRILMFGRSNSLPHFSGTVLHGVKTSPSLCCPHRILEVSLIVYCHIGAIVDIHWGISNMFKTVKRRKLSLK